MVFRLCCRSLALCALAGSLAWAQAPDVELNQMHARTPPAWAAHTVVYEVYPRAFSPEGTLAGVTAQLDRLHALGIETLWIMPVHPIGKERRLGSLGSPYAAADFYAIDPALGTKADFAALVDGAHARGMHVLLDIAADHTSRDSVLVKEHPEFFTHDAQGKIVAPQGWTDVSGLDYSKPATQKYMVAMFSYWLKTFHLDGFRCDAATYVPTAFWEQLRPALEAVKPDVFLLAEASKPDLMVKAFDMDYGWPLLGAFNRVLADGAPASAIEQTIREQAHTFPVGTEHLLISDDHDEQRAVVKWGLGGAMAASAVVFTLPGAPLLYNGQEIGDAAPSGAPALFDKVPIYWTDMHPQLALFYKALIALHASSPALQGGELVWVHNSDEAHVVTYLRRLPAETVLIAVNLSGVPFRGTVELAQGNWAEAPLIPPPRHRGPAVEQEQTAPLPPALPALSLDAYGVRIFRASNAR
jgi:cyclomaltodextrinase / maltogenic alpha-amylase / neopullulanase